MSDLLSMKVHEVTLAGKTYKVKENLKLQLIYLHMVDAIGNISLSSKENGKAFTRAEQHKEMYQAIASAVGITDIDAFLDEVAEEEIVTAAQVLFKFPMTPAAGTPEPEKKTEAEPEPDEQKNQT